MKLCIFVMLRYDFFLKVSVERVAKNIQHSYLDSASAIRTDKFIYIYILSDSKC